MGPLRVKGKESKKPRVHKRMKKGERRDDSMEFSGNVKVIGELFRARKN